MLTSLSETLNSLDLAGTLIYKMDALIGNSPDNIGEARIREVLLSTADADQAMLGRFCSPLVD